MIRLITRFFDDIHRIANSLAFPRAQDVLVELCQKDRDLLRDWRKTGPRAKKDKPSEQVKAA